MANLKIDLSNPSTFRNAINKIRSTKGKLTEAHDKVITKMTEELVETIRANARIMLGVSWAEESVHATYTRGADGLLIGQVWGADYLVYIEYGTGDLDGGQLNPDMPSGYHPETKHTVNINGTNYEKDYWVYYDERRGFVSTKGQKPKPFLRKSIQEMRKKANKKAEVVFYEWIAKT